MARTQYMLTTIDNPFDPFTQYDEWNAYDESMGYNSNALLARVTITSDELSEVDQDRAVEYAINEIVFEDSSDFYKKVELVST